MKSRFLHIWYQQRKLLRLLASVVLLATILLGGLIVFTNKKTTEPTAVDSTVSPHGTSTTPAVKSPLQGKKLFVDPVTNASQQAIAWRASRPADAALMDKLAALPSAYWVVREVSLKELPAYVQAAQADKSLPVTVVYNVPKRDCGMYSAGGEQTEQAYKAFIDRYAQIISITPSVVILEPDALAQLQEQSCLTPTERQTRYAMLNYAIEKLKSLPNAYVYVDAGNSAWIADPADIINRLKTAGVAKADGFSLNVSNFRTNNETIAYGKKISAGLGNKHFVIDTSRNGLGPYDNKARPEYNWCNPPGRALGHYPTVKTGEKLVDAFLFIKNAGESDGSDPDPLKCHNGPAAGVWSPEYALGLIKRWPAELQPR